MLASVFSSQLQSLNDVGRQVLNGFLLVEPLERRKLQENLVPFFRFFFLVAFSLMSGDCSSFSLVSPCKSSSIKSGVGVSSLYSETWFALASYLE